ncbi:BON domain-containing protein [Ottowia thiooxydans]|uniref:BON domain-containing protein n=1 Tax=Ottowia thiooxydans TaxID=219182 RepID=UPI000400397C|nr:BON domain-containing protein [Ottowia thiooxydans]
MKTSIQRLTLLAAAAALTTGLVACNKNDERTAGQKVDSAIAKTEDVARDAEAKAAAAAADARAAAARTGEQIKEGTAEMRADASAAGSRMAEAAGDAAITASVSAGLMKDPDLSAIKINVDTSNGVVSLKGPAPNAAAKDRAETIAKGVSGVKSVSNMLEVKG